MGYIVVHCGTCSTYVTCGTCGTYDTCGTYGMYGTCRLSMYITCG